MKEIKCGSGYAGKIARVDLSTGTVDELETAKYAPLFLGARGLAERVFWDEGDFDAAPYDPENTLVLMTSPLAGTLASAANQMAMFGRATSLPNPQLRASLCGSGFGSELKRCGYDGIVIKGAADAPSFLRVTDDQVEILPAEVGTLWGLDSFDARAELWRRYGDRSCALVIGTAGENVCRDAIVATDDCHSFANGGFGAVWGSKRLKAIVAKGTKDITVANPTALMDHCQQATNLMVRPPYEKGYKNANRQINVWAHHHFGWPENDFLIKQRSGEVELGWAACLNCPLACCMTHRYTDGSGVGVSHCEEMDVYSQAAAEYYGTASGNKESWQCNEMIQRVGLNEWGFTNHSVFTGLIEAGLLTSEYTGLDMDEFGSVEFFEQLMGKIVNREPGFGEDLAEGWYNVCQKLGPEALKVYDSIIVADCSTPDFQAGPGKIFKGTLAGQWINAMGMKRSTDISGNLYYPLHLDVSILADDEVRLQAIGNASEKFLGDRNIGIRPDDVTYAPQGGRWILEQSVILDSTSLCSFAMPIITSNYTDDFTGELFAAAFLNDVTGSDVTEEELRFEFADRILALERLIAYRSGHVRDVIREQNLAENGGFWPREDVESGQREFFRLFGWDEESGLPTCATLERLGLAKEAEEAKVAGVPLS